MKESKGDALRQEQGLFCFLFVAAWTKRMASGGTRPAGSSLTLKNKEQQINNLLLSGGSLLSNFTHGHNNEPC
jgi:hypothetical protein